jgi:hypothetical protein
MRNDYYIPEQRGMTEPPDGGTLGVVAVALGSIVGILLSSLLSSCSPKVIEKVVTSTELKTDTCWQTRTVRDSIYRLDSVMVDRWVNGDTVYTEKTRWKVEYRDRLKHDTIYIAKNAATETQETATPKPKEKKLGFWEKSLLAGKMLLWTLMVIAVVFTVIKVVPMIRRWIRKD